jgi:Mor family transcriptional regulator
MSANSYGVIVEGPYDSAVYEPVIRRLAAPHAYIKSLECDGKANLMKKFPGLLRTFEHEIEGNPVDMAIVVVDADGKDPVEVEARMQAKIEGRNYPFPLNVRLFAVPQAMDAWLLADIAAISAAARRRGGNPITRTYDNPEVLLDPKEWLRKLLTDHKVTYTAELCREIAREIDLKILSQRCPRFRHFAQLVDC